jgi:hypothetical protein
MANELQQNTVGRPRKFKSAEELQKCVDNYFKTTSEQGEPFMITGLCLHLDCDRRTLLNWQKDDEFFHIVKKAKLKVEASLERELHRGNNTAGTIFNLKANFSWIERQNISMEVQREYRLKTFKPAEPEMVYVKND